MEPVVYRPRDLQRILGVGEARARQLARSLGVRISAARWVVPEARLEAFLNGDIQEKER
jgi:hypothetical protein